MTLTSLILLYTGLGLAMAILRWPQAAHPLAACLAGLLWPLEILAGCLEVLTRRLTELPPCERDTGKS